MDTIFKWVTEIDWNNWAYLFLKHYEYLYLLPFPIILTGAFFLLKELGLKKWYVNISIAIVITCASILYHIMHISSEINGIDFQLLGAVAVEYMVGSSMLLLAIIILMYKEILSFFKNRKQVKA